MITRNLTEWEEAGMVDWRILLAGGLVHILRQCEQL